MTTNQNTSENTEIRPFTITIPEADLQDLQSRLARTRYAVSAPGDGWEYGTPTSYLQDMVERWKSFDWRAQEARMNAVPNFLTEIDGQTVHFAHVRSPHEDATPLLLLHTYPGSFAEFLDMIGPLTDPRRTAERPRTRSTSSSRRCRASASARRSSTRAGPWPGWPAPTTS